MKEALEKLLLRQPTSQEDTQRDLQLQALCILIEYLVDLLDGTDSELMQLRQQVVHLQMIQQAHINMLQKLLTHDEYQNLFRQSIGTQENLQ